MPSQPAPLTCGSCTHLKEGPITPDLKRTYTCQEGPPLMVFQGMTQDPKTGLASAQIGIMYPPLAPAFPACDRHKLRDKAPIHTLSDAFRKFGKDGV